MLAALFTILPALVTLVAAAPADSLVSSGSTALPATTGSITTITMGNIPGAKTATPSPTTTNTGSHASHPATSALASYTAWNQKPTGILPAPSQAPSTSSPSDFADVKLPSLEPRYVNFVVPHGGAVRYIKDGTVGADEKLSVGPSNADNYTFYLWNSTAGPVSAQVSLSLMTLWLVELSDAVSLHVYG